MALFGVTSIALQGLTCPECGKCFHAAVFAASTGDTAIRCPRCFTSVIVLSFLHELPRQGYVGSPWAKESI